MGHFLEVANMVLQYERKPLTAKEITTIAQEKNWLHSAGKTPSQTMKSKISTDILKKKESSVFMRTDKARFALRIWKPEIQEYVADRYKKALLDENAVVFPATSLKKYLPGPGLHPCPLKNSGELLRECRPMLRRLAESDTTVIQLVSVFILRHNSRYLSYKRTKRLPENRLHGSYSVFFGGHLTPEDIMPLYDIFQPEYGKIFLVRELQEEVRLPLDSSKLIYRGLLYDNSREMSRQHLGIVYDVELKTSEYEIGERGFLIDPKFETLDQMEARIDDFENWSIFIIKTETDRRKEPEVLSRGHSCD
jgi:predicted NUDIX family phosphoesterase